MRIREMELLTTHHTQQTARTPPSRFTPLVSEPPLCRRGRRQTAADTTYCSCISMPKRSFTDLDNDIILEPAQTNDVPHTTAMLYADILRALFIEAARIARDRYQPDLKTRLLRGAARIEAWRSGSPITADSFPPPIISPASSPQESSPISDDDPDVDPAILAYWTMLNCPGCCGCPGDCWNQLSAEEQERAPIQYLSQQSP